MGFFDIFKKIFGNKKNDNMLDVAKHSEAKKKPFDIQYTPTNEGNLLIEFHDNEARNFSEYDTTRLIIRSTPSKMANVQVCNCAVAWYGEYDNIMYDRNGRERGNRVNFHGVLTQIDPDLMISDENYCATVMRTLLAKNRVETILSKGLQENPEIPFGKYIGGMRKEGNRYVDFFNKDVGQASHYSPLMEGRRQQIRLMQEKQRDIDRQRKQAELRKLQAEVNGWEK